MAITFFNNKEYGTCCIADGTLYTNVVFKGIDDPVNDSTNESDKSKEHTVTIKFEGCYKCKTYQYEIDQEIKKE